MPVKSLRDAIEESIKIAPNSYGSEAFVTMSMHDAEAPVLYGISRPVFVADLPPRGTTATHRRRGQESLDWMPITP